MNNNIVRFIHDVIDNMPSDWLKLTTHRLDIYNEELAKVEFIDKFEELFHSNTFDRNALTKLPTAYDYIRLGHPLSCVLEWTIAQHQNLNPGHVISFSSITTPILGILRKNLFLKKSTQIVYKVALPPFFNSEILRNIYGYHFELNQITDLNALDAFEGSRIYLTDESDVTIEELSDKVDFVVDIKQDKGSILLISSTNREYISEIQHVRRRETIAMTPINCLSVLHEMTGKISLDDVIENRINDKTKVLESIQEITGVDTKAIVGSSGLSVQYAIMMGLIHDAKENHAGKAIKIVVPPNCYGGTNDQARRVAACLDIVEVVDLPVDGGYDMVRSLDLVLDEIAEQDAIPYIIAEIPTNPRVEVPDLKKLQEVLCKERNTADGKIAIDPVFILDQTFCPNVHFLGEGETLSTMRALSYASGSKFPSGGKCTAGYCVGNNKAKSLMEKISLHLALCDNEATHQQYKILANQLPSMNQRIQDAYDNTREFVGFIQEQLPDAKINFVSEELAVQGFTPSVFSLDLPTKGDTDEERETYKRAMNHKLIKMMISEIPMESKYCVSYGQLKGCYWTIPATSTQGTTKEGDKDYIARVALSPSMNLEKHKEVFLDFVNEIT